MDDVDVLSETITVLIVDDHEIVRRGLAMFLGLADDLEVVGLASGGAEAIRLARQLGPDVVLMDLVMPEVDGVAAIRAIKEALPETQILALTCFHSDDLVVQAIRAGAIGFLLKDVGAGALGDAIRAARAGRPTLAPEAAKAILAHGIGPSAPRPRHDLSRREREVLGLMARGLTNRQIAERLVVARSTANFHVSSVLGKLGVQSRTRAVALALQDQLVARPQSLVATR
jgi:two-component system, NarL family, response regulator LiaR